MMTKKTAINKKQQVFDSALILFVSQGIHATSTASIAKKAGVANGTLFHHFPSKDALVLALYKKIKQDFALQITPIELDAKQLKQQARGIWQQALDWAISHADQQQFCLQVMQYQPLSAEEKSKVMADEFVFLEQLIRFGQQHKIIANYPLDMMLDNAHGQFLSCSQYFVNNPKQAKDALHRDAAFNMFWQAFALS